MGTTNASAVSGSKSGSVLRYGNPVFECEGAWVRALSRQLATVVTVGGVVGTHNLERLTAYVKRFILDDKPFVLDLSAVDSIADEAEALLDAVAWRCEATGVQWAIVAGDGVAMLLGNVKPTQDAGALPVATSVAEALGHFADVNFRRRTLLLPLLTAKLNKTA
jgi:hypothetical protein